MNPSSSEHDDPARWRALRRLFEQALDLHPDARRAFVAEACEDPEMQRELAYLLEADTTADRFLADPLIQRAEPLGPEAMADTRPGDRFGPYRVLRTLGSGGMSTVYLAARDDDAFRRQVAIKLVRADRHDVDLDRRLRAERNILASLDHPNIARVLDGGTTENGRPYFVLEYVEGLPITEYADRAQLSIDERLTLFRSVLDAVSYAHQNLVIHRDLKPSNILVTADGVPKLLDFGIAKVINPGVRGDDLHATATWLRLMTPHYASPEQVRGRLIGTTSDTYSLGVLLYELLTGRLPFDFEGCSAGEIELVLTQNDPPTPSHATRGSIGEARARGLTPHELERSLSGDLDAMVMKALRSAPQRRYPSAERFADDIRRFRSGRPVSARYGGWRYRLGKMVRRHRTAAAAGVALASALLLGALGFAAQHTQVVRERDTAERERQRSQTMVSLLLNVFRVGDPYVAAGEDISVRETLESSMPTLRRRLAREPALLAEVLHTMGGIFHSLGLLPKAQSTYEEAIELRRGLYGPDHPQVAESESELAIVLAYLGVTEQARALAAESVTRLREQGPTGALLKAMNTQVAVLCTARDYQAAAPPSIEALDLARASEDVEALATALINRAAVLLHEASHAEAADLFHQGIQLLTLLHGDGHPLLARPLGNLGSSRNRAGDHEGARRAFEQALAIQQSSLGSRHPAMAPTLNNLAGIAVREGQLDQARAHFENALEILVAQGGRESPNALRLLVQIARTRIDLGEEPTANDALSNLTRDLPTWRQRLGADHRFVGLAEDVLDKAQAEPKRRD